jgi:hypothetical protein
MSRITYQGSPRLAGVLAEMLRDEAGCHIDYTPQPETRDAVGVAALAVATVQFVVQTTGTDDRVKTVVNSFLRRFSRAQPQVTIDGQPPADDPGTGSVAQELAQPASLHSEGHLTGEEFSQTKARLLRPDS